MICSCGGSHPSLTPPFQAEVISINLLNEPGGRTASIPFSLKKVTFKYLEKPETLSSRYFIFQSGGKAESDSNNTNLTRFYQLGVSDFYNHFKEKDNTLIPQDTFSLYATSCAYQFDLILQKIEEISGIHPDEILNKKGKFKIFFNVLSHTNNKKEKTGNAFYVSSFFSFVTTLPAKTEIVPLSANLRVIAHEYGHLIFDYLTTDFQDNSHIKEFKNDENNYIRGINEGFADLTSFTITGSTDIMGETFLVNDHDLNASLKIRNFSQSHFNDTNIKDHCNASYYCLGILFNHAYYQTLLSLGMDPNKESDRIKGYKLIVEAMKKTGKLIRSRGLMQGHFLRHFLRDLLDNISDSHFKSHLENHMKANFKNTLG